MRTGCSDRQNLTAGFVLQRQRGNEMKTKLILSGALAGIAYVLGGLRGH